MFTFRNINKHVDIHASTNMLISSAAFVSLLQSQIIAFAGQCRSSTPSLWTERSLNKSQNRQFTIITMYQVTDMLNSAENVYVYRKKSICLTACLIGGLRIMNTCWLFSVNNRECAILQSGDSSAFYKYVNNRRVSNSKTIQYRWGTVSYRT